MNDNKHICKYCGKEFDSGKQLGGHVVGCDKNPNKKETFEKIKKQRAKYKGTPHKVFCEYCGNEYEVICTDYAINRGKYPKTCSKECAHKLSASKVDMNEANRKRSLKLKGRPQSFKDEQGNIQLRSLKIYKCNCCGNPIDRTTRRSVLYCSDECMNKMRHEKLSVAAKKNGLGGLNINSYFKYKSGWYHGIHCDSSWELAFVLYCELNNLSVKRCELKLPYEYNGKIYNYHPDFEVNGKIYEIKGHWDEKDKEKNKKYSYIITLDKYSFKPYLEEVIKHYGKNFIDLYDIRDKTG